MEQVLTDLPIHVTKILENFTESVKINFKDNLISVVLFGSAAEGRLRASSDVNVIVVLKKFDAREADGMREDFRSAHAAVQLNVMFILESEINEASEAFAVKFMDIWARHKVLFGSDLFNNLNISKESQKNRLKQIIMNLKIRLRERYALLSLREEKLSLVVADFAGPVRSCALSILRLEGENFEHPKEALEKLVSKFSIQNAEQLLLNISKARESTVLPAGEAVPTVLGLMHLLEDMYKYIQK